MSAAADRGGPFGPDASGYRNWMRAGAPGIAFRFRPAESSPVGPRAVPASSRRHRPRVVITWIAVAVVTLVLAVSSGKLRGERVDTARAVPAVAALVTPAAASVPSPQARLDPATIARLVVPDRHIDVAVPKQASRHERSAGPGQPGNVVVTASRDSSLRFLRRVEVGDAVIVLSRHGEQFRYRVRDLRIAGRDDVNAAAAPEEPTLTLVTWYPFHAPESAATQRYVVVATADRGTV
jgi:hypothetical protein